MALSRLSMSVASKMTQLQILFSVYLKTQVDRRIATTASGGHYALFGRKMQVSAGMSTAASALCRLLSGPVLTGRGG